MKRNNVLSCSIMKNREMPVFIIHLLLRRAPYPSSHCLSTADEMEVWRNAQSSITQEKVKIILLKSDPK